MEQLEPRLLLSAGAAGLFVAADVADAGVDTGPLDSPLPGPVSALTAVRALVIIDPQTPDYEGLVEAIRDNQSEPVEVVVLDSQQDGIRQITEVLATRHKLDAVHIISHGTDGRLLLGNGWLDNTALQSNQDAVATWSKALNPGADLLFYGCDLASGSEGQALLSTFQALTGADIAASDDLTGHAALGGDWELEYQAGRIDTHLVMDEQTQRHWLAILNSAPTIVNNTGSTVLEGGTDTITTSELLYTSSHGSGDMLYTVTSGPAYGQLELVSNPGVAISGFTQTDIDSNRLIYVHNGVSTPTTDSFVFDVRKQAGGGTNFNETFSFTVTPVNDAPVIVNQSFAVDENSANGTSVGTVAASDQDPADTLSYSITAGNTGNAFAINASTGEITVNDSTQLDFESNPSFNLTVQVQDNGTGTLSDTATVTINLNDIDDTPPSVVANNGLTLAEGGTATISSAILSVTDTQQPAGSVNYTVIGGLTNGQLELTTAPGVAVTTFTQADIDAGLLVYVHDGSETLGDNFDFNVDDGLGNRITEQTFSIVVTPVDDTPPAIINNTGAHVGVGGSFVVTTDMLLAADTQPSSGLTYTLTSLPEGGELSINGVVLGLNDTFTQADIDAGSLLYTQTSLAGGDEGFTFSIDDGLGNRVTGIKFAVTPIILDGLDPVVTIDAGVPPVPVVPVPGVVNAAPVTPLIPLESGPVTSGGGSHGNPGGALEESAPPAGAPPGAPLLQPVVEAPVKDAQLQSTTIKAPENKAERSEPADQRLSDALWLALNRAQMDMDESAAPLPWLLAATRGAVWTFSAGFLAWILRGGSLLAMALSSMPMWRWMDPLPILPISRRERDERKRKSQEEAQHEIEEHRAVAAVLDKRSHQGGRM